MTKALQNIVKHITNITNYTILTADTCLRSLPDRLSTLTGGCTPDHNPEARPMTGDFGDLIDRGIPHQMGTRFPMYARILQNNRHVHNDNSSN